MSRNRLGGIRGIQQNAGHGSANRLATTGEASLELAYSSVVLRCCDRPFFDSIRRLADRVKDLLDEAREPGQSRRIRNACSAEEDDTTFLMCLDKTVWDFGAVPHKLHRYLMHRAEKSATREASLGVKCKR